MESRIARELKLNFSPVGVIFTNKKPEGAREYDSGLWSCVIEMLNGAAKGKTAALHRETISCPGGIVGLCFGDVYSKIPIEDFLSSGSEDGTLEGEGYKKTRELASDFIQKLPKADIPFDYVIFKPIGELNEKEEPLLIVFFANPDQLSALLILANYGRTGNENVIIPWGAACHTICLIPYAESKSRNPRAVIGITDITARPIVSPEVLSFTVPYEMFLEMETNVPGSFLEKKAWKKVRSRILKTFRSSETPSSQAKLW